MLSEKIQKLITSLEDNLKQLKDLQFNLSGELKATSIKELTDPTTGTTITSLIQSSEWPAAVSADSLVNWDSEAEKIERAKNVISSFKLDQHQGCNFLDFGCGEGHITTEMANIAKYSVGYDTKVDFSAIKENCLFTSNWAAVVQHKPYDVVLLYDVVDHLTGKPAAVLQKLQEVTTTESTIYIRCHPWISRHGGHLYREINKAFAHLFVQNTGEKINRTLYPVQTYRNLFTKLGLQIIEETVLQEPVEEFFKNNITMEVLKSMYPYEDPFEYISQSFIDYTLKLPSKS